MSKSLGFSVANYRETSPRAKLSPVLYRLIDTMGIWTARWRQRQALAELDDHLLDDVGLSREQARRDASKPFWTP
jgi:uncharacterized protein YjiS (DUF1127 family)